MKPELSEREKKGGWLHSNFYMGLFWKEKKKWTEWLLCSNFILPHGDTSVTQRLCDCGVLNSWGSHVEFHTCTLQYVPLQPNKEGCKSILPNCALQTDSKIDEEIIHVRCVLLEVYPRTLKQRHSIRIWSWEIRWGLKWINTLAVEWWPPAKETGISNVSSSGHQGWVVSRL